MTPDTGVIEPPPTPDWTATDVTCANDTDCNSSEKCIDQVCQVPRCIESFSSAPPVGELHTFLRELDVIVSDAVPYGANYWVDGYLPHDSLTYPPNGGSWEGTADPIVDIEGGRYFPSRPEAVAMAIEGSDRVLVTQKRLSEVDSDRVRSAGPRCRRPRRRRTGRAHRPGYRQPNRYLQCRLDQLRLVQHQRRGRRDRRDSGRCGWRQPNRAGRAHGGRRRWLPVRGELGPR